MYVNDLKDYNIGDVIYFQDTIKTKNIYNTD